MVDFKKADELLKAATKIPQDLSITEADFRTTRRRRRREEIFPTEEADPPIPQRVLDDPVRRASLQGEEVFPDEIALSVFGEPELKHPFDPTEFENLTKDDLDDL